MSYNSVIHRTMSHTSKHPFWYWIHYIGKTYLNVRNEEHKLFNAIKAGIKDEHMPWNLNLHDIDEYSNFYTLATDKHWKEWGDKMAKYVNVIPNFNNLTDKRKHSRRLAFAKREWQPVLYRTGLSLVQYVLDVMHFIIRYSVIRLGVLTIFCHCIALFTLTQTRQVLKHACMLFA